MLLKIEILLILLLANSYIFEISEDNHPRLVTHARDHWWTLDLANASLSPGVNSRAELVPSPRANAQRRWLGDKRTLFNAAFFSYRMNVYWNVGGILMMRTPNDFVKSMWLFSNLALNFPIWLIYTTIKSKHGNEAIFYTYIPNLFTLLLGNRGDFRWRCIKIVRARELFPANFAFRCWAYNF
jgi:hypothetical protein